MAILIPSVDRHDEPVPHAVSDTGLLRGALGLALLSILGLGLLYPLAGVGLGQLLFPHGANGSLIEVNGRVVGSALVAQPFNDDRYFVSRPSAAGYQPMAAAGSNLARTNPDLRQRIEAERQAVAYREGVALSEVPSDLITRSGSGFDPHISSRAARIQAARVAHARGLEPEVVAALLAEHTLPPQFGVLGQERVNVLGLNLALDAGEAHPRKD